MRTILLTACLAISCMVTAQTEYINAYNVYNSDKTLRLDFIEHDELETTVYLTYLGNGNTGTFSGLYLNDFKLVAHTTGEIFRPIESTVPSEADSKFFLHNSGTGIKLKIIFDRIPVYVKKFDLVEPTTSVPATFNFTFRNLKFDETKNAYDEFSSWEFKVRTPLYLQFFTYQYFEYLDFYVDGQYVGRLNSTFASGKVPECGEYGALQIAFADDNTRKIHVKGRSSGRDHTWNIEYRPLMYCMKVEIYRK